MALEMSQFARSAQDIDKMSEAHKQIELQSQVLEDALAAEVMKNFGFARDQRQTTGVDERIIRALRRRRRQYDPEDLELVAGSANIYIPVIDLKCRAALSWMTDILANAEEQPWTMEPTPNPEIPQRIREVVIDNLKQEVLASGISDVGFIMDRAKKYKSLAQAYVFEKAKESTGRMETIVRDQLLEGGWLDEFHKFLDDVSTYPTAIMESPVIRFKEQMTWNKDTIEIKQKIIRQSRRVDPNDIFPSFDSTNCQDGSYICIRKRLTYSDLHECLSIDAFKKDVIRDLLDKFQDRGQRVDVNTDSEENRLKERNEFVGNTQYIEGVAYYGVIKGQFLIENNVIVSDPQKPYESVVWVIDNRTVYAVLNPHPLGVRPLNSTSFKRINGAFWGEGLPDILETVERMANAAARALARNMAFASGPFGEYDGDRFSGEETEIHQVEPFRLYQTQPSMTGQDTPAFRFHNIDSHANELHAITENYMKMADDISGIPAYVLGNPQVAGAGRTMGGLSMLMGNAAKGIKQVINNIDKDVIVPIVTYYYNYELKYGDDESAKCDAKVIGRGASGILQRELSQSRTVEILAALTPFMQFVPPEGIQFLIREMLKSRGYNVDDVIPDPKRKQNIQNMFGPSSQPGTPQPGLDGRSMPPPDPTAQYKLPQTTMPTNFPGGN